MAISEATAGALIRGAATVGGAAISGAAQGSLNKKTREFNREEAERARLWSESQTQFQNAWNRNMWYEEQAYNTPTKQLERLRDAGLNPLFYGLDGNSTSQAQAAAQPLGYERASVGEQLNPISAGIDAAVKIAQVSNIQANTAKTNNENLTETQRREKLLADIENAKQELKNLQATEGLTNSQREEIDKRISWLDRLNQATINEKESAAKLNESTKKRIDELLEGEKLLQSKTLKDFDERWKKIQAEIQKMAKEGKLLDRDLEDYALNHANNGFMGSGLSLTNIIRALKGQDSIEPESEESKETRERQGDAASLIYDSK